MHVVSFFCKNYTKLPQILRSFLKQYEYFQPFKSDLILILSIHKENVLELFLNATKQTVPSNASFHKFIARGTENMLYETNEDGQTVYRRVTYPYLVCIIYGYTHNKIKPFNRAITSSSSVFTSVNLSSSTIKM